MKELRVNLPGNEYTIYIEKGLINNIASYIRDICEGDKVLIITDKNVDYNYGELVENNIKKEGFNTKKIVLESGEKSKSFEVLLDLYDEILDFGINRGDIIIALGGGVIGDLTGFAASTILRGVPFIQIPTSLLAQVDSSIGGKVAVNLKRGKNLVGSFYHPKAVFIDTNCLKTLDKRFLRDGMAEVIKYGCISDKALFEKLEAIKSEEELFEKLDDIIYTCCDIKRDVVERDEKDTRERMILNFGHTLGHAIEKYYNFDTYTHGEGVAIGMYLISKKSEELGLTKKGVSKRIFDILENFGLPTEVDTKKEEMLSSIGVDKKNIGGSINFILLKEIGEVFIHKIDKEEAVKFL